MIDESFSDADIQKLHDVGVRGTRFNFVAPSVSSKSIRTSAAVPGTPAIIVEPE